jgi:hypothetical protein
VRGFRTSNVTLHLAVTRERRKSTTLRQRLAAVTDRFFPRPSEPGPAVENLTAPGNDASANGQITASPTSAGLFANPLGMARQGLVYPVYLDIPMMASFYAATGLVEGIERRQRNVAETVQRPTAESGFEASLSEPLLKLFSLKLRLGGSLAREKRSEESVEIRSLFQHTEVSLFNQLREQLLRKQAVYELSLTGERPLREGDLIELHGRVVGNPLEQLVEAYDGLLAYAGIRGAPPRKTRSDLPWWWTVISRTAEASINGLFENERNLPKVAHLLRDDLAKAQVRDLLVEIDGPPKLSVVVVVSTEFFTGRSGDYLIGGRFTVLGKVTNAAYVATPLEFMRRTTLAAMPADKAAKVVRQLRRDVKSVGGAEKLWDATEQGLPSLQLLPLAIFV